MKIVMLSCEDFGYNCCQSCHEDQAEGYFELPEVYRKDGSLFARVCCWNLDEAERLRDEEGTPPPPPSD